MPRTPPQSDDARVRPRRPSRTPRKRVGPTTDFGARYRDLVEHLPVGVYRTTLDGAMLEANQVIADMLGYRDPGAATGQCPQPVCARERSSRAPGVA